MRNTAIAVGLFMCSLIMLSTTSAKALTPVELLASSSTLNRSTTQVDEAADNNESADSIILQTLADITQPLQEKTKSAAKPPVVYVIAKGDTLTSIATAHGTTWQRLYDKNTKLASPDTISVGEELVIPEASEALEPRPIEVSTAPAPSTASASATNVGQSAQSATVPHGSSAGNSYYAGYCTWYAKSRRPDMPNNLGNADTWVARAAAQGFATGSAPRAGAIGQQGMHVVYVERVNGDGTVTVSEMNYRGYGVVSSRTVPAGTFMYIY